MEVLDYLKFLAALIFVLALIAAIAYLARRHGLGGVVAPLRRRDRRLSVIETLPLDPRHRLVLVRRDAVEYILLVGTTSLVVERIQSSSVDAQQGGFDGLPSEHRPYQSSSPQGD